MIRDAIAQARKVAPVMDASPIRGDEALRPIYLDSNASTPVAPEVAGAMRPLLETHYGNPSSIHWPGRPAHAAVDAARRQIAALQGSSSEEIVFTSGGSEANNLAIKGAFFAARGRANHATVPPRQSCTRFFGILALDSMQTAISITWSAPFRLRVTIPAVSLDWEVGVGSTLATRLMNAAGRLLPSAAWHSSAFLGVMGRVAGPLLGVGRVGLQGSVPNGQRFIANPRVLWAITDSRAVLAGENLGPPGPVRPQAHLGGFWIPQRGMFAIGQSYFEPFDPARHSSRTGRSGDGGT